MSFDTPSSSSSSSSTGDAITPRTITEDDHALSPASPSIVDLVEYTETGGSLVIPQSLNEHWTSHSIPILLNVYYTLDFLHDTYKKSGPQGPLLWATHLFARTYITNLRYPTAIDNGSIEQTDKELGTYLGKTLSSVSAALKTPDGPMRDDVLATVWILTNYELLMGSINRITPQSPWHLHTNGLYSILKQRGTASLREGGNRMGFWPAYNMVQVRCLLTTLECPPESKEWFEAIKETLHPGEGLAVEVSEYICKMAHVQKCMIDILRARDFDAAAAEYYDLVAIIFKAEDHFTTFDASYHYIDEVFNPYLRNMLNSARVKGYHVILTFANFLSHHPATPVPADELKVLRAHCVWRVRDGAKDVMESTQRHLDPASFRNNPSPRTVFDALKLIWPLTAVYLVPSTLPEQSEAAGVALQFIGSELGVRQGLKVNRGESKLPPEAEVPSKLVEDDTFDPLPQSRGIILVRYHEAIHEPTYRTWLNASAYSKPRQCLVRGTSGLSHLRPTGTDGFKARLRSESETRSVRLE
ncbi:hypothetical protein FSPOR_11186 [Fusarium sporotrichioides]|uniref:Negative acting factor n=1 Tax=Fusarium sporotrichioides TaxID=5514 RepID=A0A395RHS7_FUSSP|nr:hypothetical protein FSPOR_11186 [Fusarium sporotrichioides]